MNTTVKSQLRQILNESITLSCRYSSDTEEVRIHLVEVVDERLRQSFLGWIHGVERFCSDNASSKPGDDPTHAWNWEQFCENALQSQDSKLAFLCLSGSNLEGCMILEIMKSGSANFRCPYLLVEYLEAAPWNRSPPAAAGRGLKGVGTALMNAAIAVSHGLGYGGRIGLHSLPSACTFYENYGMERRGEEEDSDGHWFPFFALDALQSFQGDRNEDTDDANG